MKEARLIVPVNKNDGTPMPEVHKEIQRRLVRAFGGYTRARGFGGWASGSHVVEEDIYIYDVAAAPGRSREDLRRIGAFVMGAADQDAVYVRHADGVVDIMETHRAGISEAA